MFVIAREFWNDNADCAPYWAKTGDQWNVNEAESVVANYVGVMNGVHRAEVRKGLVEDREDNLKRINDHERKIKATLALPDDVQADLNVNISDLETRIQRLKDWNERLDEKIKDFDAGSSYGMKERYVYRKLVSYGIAELSSGLTLVKQK